MSDYKLPDPAVIESFSTGKLPLFTEPQMQQAYQAGRDAMRVDYDKLKAFAKTMLKDWPDLPCDGGDIQDIAVAAGVLVGKKVTEPCGEGCNCIEYESLTPEGKFEYPVTCYHKAEFLK